MNFANKYEFCCIIGFNQLKFDFTFHLEPLTTFFGETCIKMIEKGNEKERKEPFLIT